ncbi:hypothetical protein Tco_1419024 [Tanacetum coccineum]
MKAPYYPELDLDADGTRIKCGLKRNASMTRWDLICGILSVVRIEVFFLYGYYYMKKIVFRRADLKEYTIAERDFKYLYPSDFEDMYLLNLQGPEHLPPEDKKILTTATQLNLTKPRWDATGFEFKHDLTDYKVKEFKIKQPNPGKYGDSDGYTFDDPILILEILSRRFLLRGIYLITGASKDRDGDTSFQ